MKNRYETILEAVIEAFLQRHEPIGSATLKEKLPFEIAPATIRYYFNKMVERGDLAQLHKSSGRIPTERTMRQFWRIRLKRFQTPSAEMEELSRVSENENFYMILKPLDSNRLAEVEKIASRYLILVFEKEEYVIRYQPQLESFLKDLIGYEIEEVRRIAKDVGMTTLYSKMRANAQDSVTALHPETLIDMAAECKKWGKRYVRRFLEGYIVDDLEDGIHFEPIMPKGFMALKSDAVVDERPMKMLCVGALDHDFRKVFEPAS